MNSSNEISLVLEVAVDIFGSFCFPFPATLWPSSSSHGVCGGKDHSELGAVAAPRATSQVCSLLPTAAGLGAKESSRMAQLEPGPSSVGTLLSHHKIYKEKKMSGKLGTSPCPSFLGTVRIFAI